MNEWFIGFVVVCCGEEVGYHYFLEGGTVVWWEGAGGAVSGYFACWAEGEFLRVAGELSFTAVARCAVGLVLDYSFVVDVGVVV